MSQATLDAVIGRLGRTADGRSRALGMTLAASLPPEWKAP